MQLSVVLPCYNEGRNVERAVREAAEAASSIAASYEIVVVDDGSTDDTSQVAEALRAEVPEIRVVRHSVNRGYGTALRTGFRAARFEWVFYTDGDGQFDSRQLASMRDAIGNDVLAGYRSPRRDGSWRRTMLGRAWTGLTNAVLDLRIRDTNCAFKVFPKTLLDAIPMHSTGAAIDAEILNEARRRGWGITQRPVEHRPRAHGSATGANPTVMARAVLELALIALRNATDSISDPVSGSVSVSDPESESDPDPDSDSELGQGHTRLRPLRFAS